MKLRGLAVLLVLSLLVSSCTQDRVLLTAQLDNRLEFLISQNSPDGTMDYYILDKEDDYANIPQDPKNPLTAAKVELGKMLFFDSGLAQDAVKNSGLGTYSCATCHIPEAGFKPGGFQGIADGGIGYGIDGDNRRRNTEYEESELDVQSARPLTMVNVGYVTNTFWNGQFGATEENVGTEDVWDNDPATARNHLGFEGIETQNFAGLIDHRIQISKPLLDQLGYTPLFDEVFADVPVEDRYTTMTGSLAFSAYIRTIISNRAPFQDWLKGDKEAMTFEEKEGAVLFFGKALCTNCHYKKNLGSLEFHALGVKDMYQRSGGAFDAFPTDKRNLGRGGFTLKEEDNFKFKVPGIYNSEETPFFFHGASVEGLEDLIEYKDLAQTENPNVPQSLISDKFEVLNLTDEEKANLVKFLRYSLTDPDLVRYKPDAVLSGACIPNNDEQSRIDLGCN